MVWKKDIGHNSPYVSSCFFLLLFIESFIESFGSPVSSFLVKVLSSSVHCSGIVSCWIYLTAPSLFVACFCLSKACPSC